MKLIKFLFLITVLFYLGEENLQPIAGIQGEANFKDWTLKTEVRSYIAGVSSQGFYPNKVLYKVGIGYGCIEIRHECEHLVDTINYGIPSRDIIAFNL